VAEIPEEAVAAAIQALTERTAQDPGSDGEKAARWHAVVALEAAWPGFVAAAEERTAGMAEALNNAASIIEDRDRQLAAARAEERARLANRAEMIDEVRHELDDAFQFANADGSRHGYVTREWVQALLATHAASAGAAECERIITLASAMRATIPADHPEGARASFADYLRVTAAEGGETP
jgi:hypothetical protein